jgi:transcriptional regulator with XRE-family HTH domain
MSTAGIVALAEVRLATESGHAKAVRQAARISQSELARNVGVSQASISRWEAGNRIPRGKAARRYAKVLRALEKAVG